MTRNLLADVTIEPHGSIVMVRPMTATALDWVHEHVALESWAWIGGAFACEPRLVENLVDGMIEAGLVVA